MHFACGYGEVKYAKILLEEGVALDALDKNKSKTLHYAVLKLLEKISTTSHWRKKSCDNAIGGKISLLLKPKYKA